MAPRKKKASLLDSETQPENQAENQAENPSEEQPEDQSHKYDASFKGWMDQRAPEILPLLVPGVAYEQDLNVEVIPPAMRTDKVFQVQYEGVRQILHIEFEVHPKREFRSRLMVYNAMLHYKHQCPVTTVVIYPFKISLPKSPYVVRCGGRKIQAFEFDTLPLFKMKARPYVEHHQTCIYPLLPTMPDIDVDLMEQAIRELSMLYLDPDDQDAFSDMVSWMKLLLERNQEINEVVKQQIMERVKMFEQLWEESPTVQKMRAEYYQKGEVIGREKGEVIGMEKGRAEGIEELQRTLVECVQAKFPALTELAQRQAQLCKKLEVLGPVTRQLLVAQDAEAAQKLLCSLSEQ